LPRLDAPRRCFVLNLFFRLYTDLLKDSLNEYSYDAEVAGLHYNIENQLEGMLVSVQPIHAIMQPSCTDLSAIHLQLGIGGYNDKLPVLLERVVSKMKDFEVDIERFNLVKDQVREPVGQCLWKKGRPGWCVLMFTDIVCLYATSFRSLLPSAHTFHRSSRARTKTLAWNLRTNMRYIICRTQPRTRCGQMTKSSES
jgi:hypothetical protein